MNVERWMKIESVFHEALERPDTERNAFLDTSCGGDTELRRRIELLIAQAEKEEEPFQQEFFAAAAEALREDAERLMAGQSIGHYEIVSLIGIGGMGEVYKATDRQLKRLVAIKVLPLAFTKDPERLARFQQEAELLASLNHPNIAVVHGIEDFAGTPSIVLELVEGETLAERIAKGAVPVEDTLKIARQIAEALEAAHEKNLIHRDLKPANVKVTPDGRVKVLDFGLAKILHADVPPTLVSEAGAVLLGTPIYMSPEQVTSRSVDRASDIWAFGCVLYEMLTGKRAFDGDSLSEILSGIVKTDPDWNALPETTPSSIRTLLRRCLNKDRTRRLHDIADARIEIEEALSASTSAAHPEAGAVSVVPKPRKRLVGVLATTIVSVVAIIAAFTAYRPSTLVTAGATRFTIPVPRLLNPTISPDGRYLAYTVTNPNARNVVWLRPMDSTSESALPETEGVDGPPFWSPDSSTIAFFAAGKLRKIAISGGPTQVICDVPGELPAGGHVGTWGRSGIILFESQNAIYKVSASGEVPTSVKTPDAARQETQYRFPYFLPNGRDFLFLAQTRQTETAEIRAASLDRSETKTLTHDRSSAKYAEPGYLLFVRNETLVAQPFDASSWSLSGSVLQLQKPILYSAANGWGSFSVSDTGALVHTNENLGTSNLTWFDRNGKQLSILNVEPVSGPVFSPNLSADGKHLAMTADNGIWVLDMLRGTNTRLTSKQDAMFPILSPDDRTIVFVATVKPGLGVLHLKSVGGTEAEEPLGEESTGSTSWSSDGRFVLFTRYSVETLGDVWALSMTGDRKASPVVQTKYDERRSRFSPDGKKIAYTSNASGRFEVYVQEFPPSGKYWQVSANGGDYAQWRRDGKELFFLTPEFKKMMAVEVKPSATFGFGLPHVLFQIPSITGAPNYAVSLDGQRFILSVPAGKEPELAIAVVLNWPALLRK